MVEVLTHRYLVTWDGLVAPIKLVGSKPPVSIIRVVSVTPILSIDRTDPTDATTVLAPTNITTGK